MCSDVPSAAAAAGQDRCEEKPEAGTVPKCTFRTLEELCVDFKRRCGSTDSSLQDDAQWDLPSNEASDDEDDSRFAWATADPQPCKRFALGPLEKLQRDFQARQRERTSSLDKATVVAAAAGAIRVAVSDGHAKGAAPVRQAAAARTGTLKKLVERKGFGFIVPDGESTGDVFLHCSELTNGNSQDMLVGIRVQYVGEADPRSGKTRAKNAVILGKGSEAGCASPVVEKKVAAAIIAPAVECRQLAARQGVGKGKEPATPKLAARGSISYTRADLLAAFCVLGQPYDRASRIGITTIHVPKVRGHGHGKRDQDPCCQEDPLLDDEDLIAEMEARLSRESGFDVLNKETFGECCSTGWSFEEAVAANAKLASCHLSTGLSFGANAPASDDPEELEQCPSTTVAGSADGASGDSSGGCSRGESPAGSPGLAPSATGERSEVDTPLSALAGFQLQ